MAGVGAEDEDEKKGLVRQRSESVLSDSDD
jgi:hypothetical protein